MNMANQLNVLDNLRNLQDLDARRRLRRERVFRDVQNPFEYYNDDDFHRRFRFTKANARYIIDLLADDIRFPTNRSHALPPFVQVLVALRFYGDGSFQISVGDNIHVHQTTVSRTVLRISRALAQGRAQFIKMPHTQNATRETQQEFFDMHAFPNVIGLIDGTHIRISNPGGDEAARFLNRKGFHSINTQVICDAKPLITNIVARWPGSAHDSRIFDQSRVKNDFENGLISGHLLGDPGYPCLTYLMTPLRNPLTPAERNYNRSQRRTRSLVERLFGVWKQRFSCLHNTLRLKLETSFAVIIATAVLQNIAILRRDPGFGEDLDDDPPVDPVIQPNLRGPLVRARLIEDHF